MWLHLANSPPASMGTNEQVLWVGLVPTRSKKAASSADEWLCEFIQMKIKELIGGSCSVQKSKWDRILLLLWLCSHLCFSEPTPRAWFLGEKL